MKIKQIRSATNKITYGGKTFLLDPWLVEQYGLGCFDDMPDNPYQPVDFVMAKIPMPLFPLPETVESVLQGVDAYIITHIHPDHIDINMKTGTYGDLLNHKLPVFVHNQEDACCLRQSGFEDVRIMEAQGIKFGDVVLNKTPALHGTIKSSAQACGILFQAENEKSLYVAGDTIWYEGVRKVLEEYEPEVIMLNACGAELKGFGRLIMNDEDVDCVHQTLPNAKLLLTHFDNVAHGGITRREMRARLVERGITDYVMLEDGETFVNM